MYYKTYLTSIKQVFTVNTESGLNPVAYRQNGDRRLTFIGCKCAWFFFPLVSRKVTVYSLVLRLDTG